MFGTTNSPPPSSSSDDYQRRFFGQMWLWDIEEPDIELSFSVYGSGEYVRIGPKCGFLTLSYKFYQAEGLGDNEEDVCYFSDLRQMFGLNFKTPSTSYMTGTWRGSSSYLTNHYNAYYSYSPVCQVKNNGTIQLGRIQNTSSKTFDLIGLGTQSSFGTITISDVYLEEV